MEIAEGSLELMSLVQLGTTVTCIETAKSGSGSDCGARLPNGEGDGVRQTIFVRYSSISRKPRRSKTVD